MANNGSFERLCDELYVEQGRMEMRKAIDLNYLNAVALHRRGQVSTVQLYTHVAELNARESELRRQGAL